MPDDYSRIHLPAGSGVPHTVDHPELSLNVPDDNIQLSTGDLRRGYNFGRTYTMLSYNRDKFLHLLNTLKGRRKPTDDAKFKYTFNRRTGQYKRYAYIVGLSSGVVADNLSVELASVDFADFLAEDSDKFKVSATNTLPIVAGTKFSLLMAGDYITSGNLVNKVGRDSSTNGFIKLGQNGTKPTFFLPNSTIKINTTDVLGSQVIKDWATARVESVYDFSFTDTDSGNLNQHGVILNVVLLKASNDETMIYPVGTLDTGLMDVSHTVGTDSIAQKLEPSRTYIMGNVNHELSGYGATWRQQPYSTADGLTQIFKKTAMMSGRARATVLKFEKNPWKEEWTDKMLEYNWDLGGTAYWGHQYEDPATGETYTQGLVDFVENNGNRLDLDLSVKNIDNFLEDVSALNDPRYNYGNTQNNVLHSARTDVWNWLHMVGGFHKNNLDISDKIRFMWEKSKVINGVNYSQFSTLGGKFNVMQDIHLDGSHIKMLGIDMSQCWIRPFIGNENRDTTIYRGVKSISQGGQDYTVDLIQGDIGFEFGAPEKFSAWH